MTFRSPASTEQLAWRYGKEKRHMRSTIALLSVSGLLIGVASTLHQAEAAPISAPRQRWRGDGDDD